jgi:hypothetical protein
VVYDADKLGLDDACTPERRKQIMQEWINVFRYGPGIIVIRGAFTDDIMDRSRECFLKLIQKEQESGKAVGDHFGTNSRLWNSLEKMAVEDPELYCRYYESHIINTVSEAWLGPKF